MDIRFTRQKLKIDHKITNYKFQAIEWYEEDIISDDFMDVDDEPVDLHKEYNIKIFGVSQTGDSVCCNVKGFTPFFYIKVPNFWTKNDAKKFIDVLFNSTGYYNGKSYLPLSKYKKYLDLDKTILQNKMDFYGFTNNKKFRFLRLTFTTQEAMKKTIYFIKNHNDPKNKIKINKAPSILPLYESNVDAVLRVIHIKNLKPCGWLEASNISFLQTNLSSRCQVEFNVSWTDLSPLDIFKNAPILQASFDIETYSYNDAFPSPKHPENCIFQIATAFKKVGQENFTLKTILCLSKTKQIDEPDIFMKCFEKEKDLILYWAKMICDTDPDILYTYNGDMFDCDYLCERAKLLGIEDEFFEKISRLVYQPSKIIDDGFNSSAYGDNKYRRLVIYGRINFDILIYIRREYKETSYKLDYISEKYLGENKNPVTAQMMFDFFRNKDSDGLNVVAKYCVQDTLLPQKLVDKLHILQNQLSMSNVTFTPLKALIEKGQQIKVFSQILKLTRELNYVIPFIDNYASPVEEKKFKGATVLEPQVGAFFEPIAVCDFASLYPSIMRAHNLCYSTIVLDNAQYGNIEGVVYQEFEWEDTIDGEVKQFKYKYAKSVDGVLPKLLENLSEERKYYKKLMKEADNQFDKEIYNKCQLAVKVSMNSVYGFLAAFKLRCKPIAATVTAIGRKMIIKTKDFIETNYPASVGIYGDSVTGNTPLLLRDSITGNIHIETIQNVMNKSASIEYPEFKIHDTCNRSEKTYSKTHYEVWTDKGWSIIKKVIRHKTHKKIYKVMTLTGIVEVTEDHSLLDKNCNIIKPTECSLNTELLCSYPLIFEEKETCLSKNKAFLRGVCYDKMGFPDDILYNSKGVIGSFFRGYLSSHDSKTPMIKCTDQIDCARWYLLLKKLQYSISLSCKDNNIYIHYTELPFTEKMNTIQSIEYKDYGEIYVYDLETEIGRFQAGVGDIIVKNTDSVFIKFNTPTLERYIQERNRVQQQVVITENDHAHIEKLKVKCIEESMTVAAEAATKATENLFTSPISLEYEKVYSPLLMLSKKRYIGKLYSNNANKMDKLDNKGVVLTRRDNFILLKKSYQHLINLYTDSNVIDPNKDALEYITEVMNKIKNNSIEIDDLIISKSLKSDYKSTNLPHVVLSKKIKERDPNNAPKSNDRIPYIFIDNGDLKKVAQYTKVEDPEYVKKHNLPLDVEYYIGFLKNPMCEILELFMSNPEKLFDDFIDKYKQERLLRIKPDAKMKVKAPRKIK